MARPRRRPPLLWWAAVGLLGAGLGLGIMVGRLTAPPTLVVHRHALVAAPLPGCALAPHGPIVEAPSW